MELRLGCHWIFDGHGASAEGLGDEALVRRALEELPERLRLTKVAPAQTFHHGPPGETTVAGIVLIAESHFSLHAFPAHGVLHGDLFSCKPFDVDAARAYLTQLFGIRGFREELHERRAPGDVPVDLPRHGS